MGARTRGASVMDVFINFSAAMQPRRHRRRLASLFRLQFKLGVGPTVRADRLDSLEITRCSLCVRVSVSARAGYTRR